MCSGTKVILLWKRDGLQSCSGNKIDPKRCMVRYDDINRLHSCLSYIDMSNEVCTCKFEMTPRVSVNFVSLVSSCVALQEEEPQTFYSMSFTWAYDMVNTVLIRDVKCYPIKKHKPNGP